MEELSFCRRTWSPHFNQGGASNTRYVIVEDDPDPTMEAFAAAVEAFSTSLIETVDNAIDANLGVDPDVPPGALVCGGGQLSNGFSRGWHTDRLNLGDIIITCTLEGHCQVYVGRPENHRYRCKRTAWTRSQSSMDFYGIWGPSRDAPVEHYVECSSPSERLSLTLRYVTSQPPSADSVQQVMRSDQQAGSRALRASKRARLHDDRPDAGSSELR